MFQVSTQVRPLGSWKAYVDADLVGTWRALLDGQAGGRPGRVALILVDRADLARTRTALVAPGQRHLVRGAARVRGRLGLPPRAFDGDHYDLVEDRYADALAAGARPVTSREIVAALHAAGLRRRKRSRLGPLSEPAWDPRLRRAAESVLPVPVVTTFARSKMEPTKGCVPLHALRPPRGTAR